VTDAKSLRTALRHVLETASDQSLADEVLAVVSEFVRAADSEDPWGGNPDRPVVGIVPAEDANEGLVVRLSLSLRRPDPQLGSAIVVDERAAQVVAWQRDEPNRRLLVWALVSSSPVPPLPR
jgi:hypothetical protein